jgi:SAM-dependent methyltransferase
VVAYYTRYYRDRLGLPDWSERVEARLREEDAFAEPVLRRIEGWLDYDFRGKRVLVVGAGTGAESGALARRGARVVGLEPDRDARRILRLKALSREPHGGDAVASVAEAIPFREGQFDFVYCYTTLEHARAVERSLDEMIRVCRTRGWIFIQTPDSRFPWEGHYKLRWIPRAPRWLAAIWLRLHRRPTGFLGTLHRLSAPDLDRLFWRRDVVALRVFEPHLLWWERGGDRLLRWFCERFAIQKHQVVLLRKIPGGDARVARPGPGQG